jgi:hypothetical protein
LKIAKGSNSTSFRLNGAAVSIGDIGDAPTPTETVDVQFTPYDGAATFTWTLVSADVASTGTYWDGTPYVVAASSTVRVVAVNPSPKEQVLTGVTVSGGSANLTIRYDGVMINPVMGHPQDYATVRGGTYTSSSGGPSGNGATRKADGYGLTSDNRVNADLTTSDPQGFLDSYFDVTEFNALKADFPGDGVSGDGRTLNVGDVMVLTRSMMDETFLNASNQNSRIVATPSGWSPRSGIKEQAFLYVISSAPAANEFRPPPQWLTENDATNGVTGSSRPVFTDDDLLDLTTYRTSHSQGLVAGIGKNFYPSSKLDWPDTWGSGTLSKPPVSAFFPAPLLADDGYYSASIAPFNLIPGCDVTYGGDMYIMATGYLMNEALRSGSADRDLAQKKLVQAGIDCIGAMSCRTALTGGAGQRPGQTTPLALFALRNLGTQISSEGIDGTGIEDLVKWIWDIDTLTWNGLTDVQKRNLRGAQSYEENVCWSLGMMESEYAGTNTVGHTYKSDWTTSTTSSISVTADTALRSGDIATNSSNLLQLNPLFSMSTTFTGTLTSESSDTWEWESSVTVSGDFQSESTTPPSNLTSPIFVQSPSLGEYKISEVIETTTIQAYLDAGFKTYVDSIYIDVPLNTARFSNSSNWNRFFSIVTSSTSVTCNGVDLLSSISGATMTPVYSSSNAFLRLRVNLLNPSGDTVDTDFSNQQSDWSSYISANMTGGESVIATVAYRSATTTGAYEFDLSSDAAGRLDFSTAFAFPGADFVGTHAGGHTNLIGCTAVVDSAEYYIVGVTENVESTWFDYDNATPAVRVYLDRPLDSEVSSSTVTIKPFRSGDTNRVYFIREPQTSSKWDWATPSAWNDDYSNKFHTTSVLPYLLMRRIDGDWSKLGNCGTLISQYYGGADEQCAWQPFNGNEVKKKFGSVSAPAIYQSANSTELNPFA